MAEYLLDWMKIADLLLIAQFCASPILYYSYLNMNEERIKLKESTSIMDDSFEICKRR